MVARKYDELVPQWTLEYGAGENIYTIGRRYGVSPQSVWSKLVKSGLKLRPKTASRRYPLKSAAFDDLRAPDACYWLGLLYADGCLTEHNGSWAVGLVANTKDAASISGFCEFLGYTGPAFARTDKQALQVRVVSRPLGQRLFSLGVIPRKTHVIAFPSAVPVENRRHFVRGYFDGDGSIYFRQRPRYVTPQGTATFTGAVAIVEGIAEAIRDETGMSPTSRGRFSHSRSVSISYEGRSRLLRLREYLYGDGGPFLPRKKDTFSMLDAK